MDKIATYTWDSFVHAKIGPEKRSSSLLVPFGMVEVAHLAKVVRCKLARTCHVPKKRRLLVAV
jgi:hypothetical protein